MRECCPSYITEPEGTRESAIRSDLTTSGIKIDHSRIPTTSETGAEITTPTIVEREYSSKREWGIWYCEQDARTYQRENQYEEYFAFHSMLYIIDSYCICSRAKIKKNHFTNNNQIVSYNSCIHMYIFDLHFYSLHIAPTWYGLSYALGFMICYFFMRYYFSFREIVHSDTLLSYIFIGVILGGRIGYILLYNLSYFIQHPSSMIRIWEWGMSFHGGLIGTILAVLFFAWRYQYQFWSLIDTLAVIIPVALGLGRIGNWINQELPGYTPYDGIWAMQIAGRSHFPSPLLEMFLEGIVLFVVMLISWRLSRWVVWKNMPKKFKIPSEIPWFLSGIFLIGYSLARLIAEQYRLPDTHIGYLLSTHWLTLGMIYTIPMIVYGVYLVIYTSTLSRHGSK